jgi:hypothetical protein
MYTLGDARVFISKYVEAGLNPTSDAVKDRVNEIIESLLYRGNWKLTERKLRIATTNNVLPMPREVEKIIGDRVTIDRYVRNVFDMNYEFLENGPGEFGETYSSCPNLLDLGWFPTFFEIPETVTKPIFAISTASSDVVKTITITGRDSARNEITEEITINKWSGGIEGTIINFSDNITLSTNNFYEITTVNKPVTDGYVTLYAYDSSTSNLWFLSKYHMDETVPNYRRYRILNANMPDTRPTTDTTYGHHVLCLVKLKYIPAKRDSDVLLIQNKEAIQLWAQAIREQNTGNIQQAKLFKLEAIEALNAQLTDTQTNEIKIQINDTSAWGRFPDIGP